MPLGIGHKWGVVPYLPSWPLVQQTGWYGAESQPMPQDLMRWVRRHFARVHLAMPSPPATHLPWGLRQQTAHNLVLDLSSPYATITAGYSKGLLDNLRKGRRLVIGQGRGAADTWALFHKQVRPQVHGWTRQHDGTWMRLIGMECPHYTWVHLVAHGPADPAPLAAASFLVTDTRIVYLMGATTPDGRTQGATAAILDQVIKTNAETGKILDFEGGNIGGTSQFFASFGASEELYYIIEG